MERIYSKIEPGKLLHFVVRDEEFQPGRFDLLHPNNFLQCSMLNLNKGVTFKPHRHIWKDRDEKVIAQESWVVMKGSVKCFFYDLDNTFICEKILRVGDASFTLEAGHNYEILEDGSKVFEYKTGPYRGQEQDKVFI